MRRAARPGIIHLMPLAIALQRRTTLAGFLVNAISAAMLAVYMTVVFPPETDSVFITREFALTAVGIYTVICGITSYRSAQPVFDRMRAWLAEGRAPTSDERRSVMRLPVFFARMTFARWALAVPLFALPNLEVSSSFALEIAVTTALAVERDLLVAEGTVS